MTLVRWEPYRDTGSLHNDLNRLVSSFFDGRDTRAGWAPPVDLYEDGKDVVLKADLPGLSEDDVNIEAHDGVLTVSGERSQDNEHRGDGFYRVERSFGSFRRSLRLPEDVDPQSITANFDRGVLEVRIPKPEAKQPHRIKVEAEPVIEGKSA